VKEQRLRQRRKSILPQSPPGPQAGLERCESFGSYNSVIPFTVSLKMRLS
jgi:hypothetical protein